MKFGCYNRDIIYQNVWFSFMKTALVRVSIAVKILNDKKTLL